MVKISYEVEYAEEEKVRMFERPQFINLYIEYKDYRFAISSDFDHLFSNETSLMGLFISNKNRNLYSCGEAAYSNYFEDITKEKILKKPLYKKIILNMEKKIRNFFIQYPYSSNHYNMFKVNIPKEEIEKILDIWQLIVKKMFSERDN